MFQNKTGKLKELLQIASIPKSTYFEVIKRKDKDEKNQKLIDKIIEIYEKNHGRYGVRRIHAELIKLKFVVNHKKVQRIMKRLKLRGIKVKEKYHSYQGQEGPVAKNILKRDFKASKANEKRTTDVSQFNLPFGKVYLSPILDMYNNEIISYDVSLHPNFEQIERMLDKAFIKNPDLKNLIFHSDQGWQYQNPRYVKILKEKGIIQSMSRKGNCFDNSIMESFFGILKNEFFYGHEKEFETLEDFKVALDKYINYYNEERIKERLNWESPVNYRVLNAV